MRAASPVLFLSFAWCLGVAPSAQAVGFGRVATHTLLGQPLDFSAAVRLEADESLTRDCVFAEVMAGDNRVAPGLVRLTLDGNPGDLDRNVHVTTTVPIDEPVVAVSVTLGCTAKVTRRFVAFIDPPGVNLAQAASADTAPPSGVRADVQTAAPPVQRSPVRPVPTGPAAPPAARTTPPRAADAAPRAVASPPIADATEHRAASQAPAPAPAPAPRRATAGPRLQLEAPTLALGPKPAASAPVMIAAAPAPAPAATPAPAPAASAPVRDEQAELLALQRQRIAALEDEVRRLQADARVRQQSMLTVRTELPVRRSDRFANPLTYSLALLFFLATIFVCGFLGRRARDRASARWSARMALAVPESVATANPAAPVVAESVVEPSLAPVDAPPVEPETPLHRTSPLAVVRTAAPTEAPLPVIEEAIPPRSDHAASVEELIDLEQQVDFFVVLGQDDAAIELLTNHAVNDPGGSPMPLLKLLEIHRRLGDRPAHDRVLAQVGRDFNVSAPGWEADPAQGRSLDAYRDTLARLQTLWPTPATALAFLDDAVLRRSAVMPAFDLPAYRELLLLHSIARDHATSEAAEVTEAASDVDLLLPLDLSAAPAPIARLAASRESGMVDFASSELLTAPLDLDVSFETPASRPATPLPRLDSAETVPAALRRPADYSNESSFVDFEIDLPDALAPTRRG